MQEILTMRDWQVADGLNGADDRPWQVEIKSDGEQIIIDAICPDGTKREVWVEIQDGNLVVHGYDPEHDEPINMRIGRTDTVIDSDR